MKDIIKKLRPIIQEIVESKGVFLYDMEFVNEEGNDFLRIAIEKADHTMDFETAEVVSDAISAKLDELDPIDHEYILDVCSPGAERPLKNKEDYVVGNYITVVTENESYTGDLLSFNNDVLEIAYKDKTRTKKVLVDFKDVKEAHLAVKF